MSDFVISKVVSKFSRKLFSTFVILLRSTVVAMVLILSVAHFVLAQNANVTISKSATSGGVWSGGTFTPIANNANIQNTDIERMLNFGNITIHTVCPSCTQEGNVTSSANIQYKGFSQRTLSINAFGTVTINKSIDLTGNVGAAGGSINIEGISGVMIKALLITNGNASDYGSISGGGNAGNITLNSSNGIVSVTAGLYAKGGSGKRRSHKGYGHDELVDSENLSSINYQDEEEEEEEEEEEDDDDDDDEDEDDEDDEDDELYVYVDEEFEDDFSEGDYGGSGGSGGNIFISGTSVVISTKGTINTSGGYSRTRNGGAAGNITINATSYSVSLRRPILALGGKTGSYGSGIGGAGGSVFIRATTNISTAKYGSIMTTGACGVTAGGAGGAVTLIGSTGLSLEGSIYSLGGTGSTVGVAGLLTIEDGNTSITNGGINDGQVANYKTKNKKDKKSKKDKYDKNGNYKCSCKSKKTCKHYKYEKIISGIYNTGGLTKTGSGSFKLSLINTYIGATTIKAGILTLGATRVIPDESNMIMYGGAILSTFNNSTREVLGTLQMNSGTSSTIALAATGGLNFAASNAVTWNGDSLYITGWTCAGLFGSDHVATGSRIFFGTTATGLTTAQLSYIRFINSGYKYEAKLLTTGELVPTLPTSSITTTGALAALSACVGTASSNTSFTVSATDITDANVVVSAPSGFEVSTSTSSGFASSVNLPVSSGTLSTTTLYVRMPSSNLAGSYSGNVTVSGKPASSKTVSTATSTVNARPTVTFTSQPGANACINTDVNYTTQASQSNYVWTVPGVLNTDYSITSGGVGTTSNTVTLRWLTSGSKTVTVNYTYANGCAATNATSSTATTVSPTSVGGTATAASSTICTGSTTTVSVSGHTGTIQWQQSADGSTGWANVSGGSGATTATYTTPTLTATTYYRAVITSGACASANSTTATVTVSPASVGGTIAGSATVCTGTNSTVLTLSGHIGNVTRWESSLDNFATAGTSIANTTTTLTATSLTATTSYRAVVTSGACTAANSSTATVTVSPASVGGTIAGSATVCTGTNSTVLTLSGHTGNVTRWESSLDNFATAGTSIANTTTTLTATNLTATTSYRAVITSGACTATNSAIATVTVNALPIVNFTSQPSSPQCSNTEMTYTTQAGQSNYVWIPLGTLNTDYSISSEGGSANNSITLKWLTNGDKVVTINYTDSRGCRAASATSSDAVTVNLTPTSVTPTLATICSGTSPSISLQGKNGTAEIASTYTWALGTNTGNITGASASSGSILDQSLTNPSNVTAGSIIYAVTPTSIIGSCTGPSTNVTVTVNPIPFVVNDSIAICLNKTFSYSPSGVPTNPSTTYSWPAPSLSGPITGTSAQSGQSSVSQTLRLTSGTAVATYTVTPSAGGCEGLPFTLKVLVTGDHYWSGTVSNSWNESSNWLCGEAPSISKDAIITASANVVIESDVECKNLVMASGAKLSLGSNTLKVYGNWSNNGTFLPGTGTVEFVGNTKQTITKSGYESFYNLTVDKNQNDTLLTGNTYILSSGTLLVKRGVLDVPDTKVMFLQSGVIDTATLKDNTARLASVTGNISSRSNFVIQRYIVAPLFRLPYTLPGSPMPMVFLAPTVKNMYISQWNDDITVSQNSVSQFNEKNTNGGKGTVEDRRNTAWQFVGTSTLVMPIGKGYKVTVGHKYNGPDLLVTVGKPQVGSHSVALTYTDAGTQGWNLVGNPYPCEIDWDLVYADNSNLVEPNIFILDPYNTSKNNNTYYSYNALTGLATYSSTSNPRPIANSSIIQSSEGFFTIAKNTINSLPASNRNITFKEDHKINDSNVGEIDGDDKPIKTKVHIPHIRISISEGAATITGQTVVAFSNNAKDGYDDYDTPSISDSIAIYTLLDDSTKMLVNTLNSNNKEVNVPLVVNPNAPLGSKYFTITTMTDYSFRYFLYDDYLGTSTFIVKGAVIPFEFTSDSASRSTNRFRIVTEKIKHDYNFRIITTPFTTESEFDTDGNSDIESTGMVLSPNPNTTGKLDLLLYGAKAGTAEVEILDSRGIVVYKTVGVQTRKTSFGADAHLEFGHLPAGVYAVRCTHAGGTSTKKMVVNK